MEGWRGGGMCSGCPSTAGSHVASLGHGPGEQADRQSAIGGKREKHRASGSANNSFQGKGFT